MAADLSVEPRLAKNSKKPSLESDPAAEQYEEGD